MAGVIVSDGDDNTHVQRPQRKSRPSAALLEHSEAAALPSQQKRIEEFRAAEAAKRAAEIQAAIAQVRAQRSTPPESSRTTSSAGPSIPPSSPSPSPSPSTSGAPEKRGLSEVDLESGDDDDSGREDARNNPKPKG